MESGREGEWLDRALEEEGHRDGNSGCVAIDVHT